MRTHFRVAARRWRALAPDRIARRRGSHRGRMRDVAAQFLKLSRRAGSQRFSDWSAAVMGSTHPSGHERSSRIWVGVLLRSFAFRHDCFFVMTPEPDDAEMWEPTQKPLRRSFSGNRFAVDPKKSKATKPLRRSEKKEGKNTGLWSHRLRPCHAVPVPAHVRSTAAPTRTCRRASGATSLRTTP